MKKNKANFDLKWISSTIIALAGILLSFNYLTITRAIIATILIAVVTYSSIYFIGLVAKNRHHISQFFRLRNIRGIIGFCSERSEFDWSSFYKKHNSPREIIFMGQSLGKAFSDKQISLFTQWCNNGASFRILLLSPSNSYSQQLRLVSEGMIEAPAEAHPQSILKSKIHSTISQIEEKFIKKVAGEKSLKPYLRFSTVDLPFSLIMIDDDMIVTLYTTEAEADVLPTFIIKGKDALAFKGFKKEFESIWEKHSVISPYKDVVLKDSLKYWDKYLKLKRSYYNKEKITTPPKQAIIFPTYKCSNSCGFCMYKEKEGNVSISAADFQNILIQLINYKTTHIELSGGGEPLEVANLNNILDVLAKVRGLHPEIKFGLITNGLFLEKTLKKHDLLYLFNDYIRVSRLNEDDIDEKKAAFEKKQQQWINGINLLFEKKNSDLKYKNTKVGIKYLLSSNNKKSFVDMVNNDINSFLYKFDHVRFRSERTVNADDIYPIEQDIYRLLRNSDKMKSGFETKVALSLPNVYYPQNFKCWISPVHVVIEPKGDTYICCNYLLDSTKAKIGNILKQSFKDIWESKEHVASRHSLSKEICNCREHCFNCRFAELQFSYEHIIATLGYDYTTM